MREADSPAALGAEVISLYDRALNGRASSLDAATADAFDRIATALANAALDAGVEIDGGDAHGATVVGRYLDGEVHR